MALAEFLHNIQTARNVVFLHLYSKFRDGSTPDPSRAKTDWERLRAAAPLWLSPTIFRAFDIRELTFLRPERREELSESVQLFRRVVEAIGDRLPTNEELRSGLDSLNRIVERLDEFITDTEGPALLFALLWGGEPLPDFVLGFDYTLDTDATGDRAVWVWVILSDTLDPESPEFIEFARIFPTRVRKALHAANSDRLTYIRYRPLSEARLLLEGVAA